MGGRRWRDPDGEGRRGSRSRRGARRGWQASRWGVAGAVCLALVTSGGGVRAQDGYAFRIAEVEARPGESVTVSVGAELASSVQGFSLALRYPPEEARIDRVHVEGTIVEAIGADFVEAVVDPAAGELTVGVLVDTEPPFEGGRIPAIQGLPLDLLRIELTLWPDVEDDVALWLEDGLSDPPIDNLFVLDDEAVPVSDLAVGWIRLERVSVSLFLRGDTNQDAARDMTDAIAILRYRFLGGIPLPCLDAADVNDDRSVDLSDSVHLLGYLFLGGPAPPPPLHAPGPDPTVDDLDCAIALEISDQLVR